MHMISVLKKSFAGLLFFLIGFIMGYAYFIYHTTPILAGIAAIFIISGIILLVMAIRGNNIMKQVSEEAKDQTPAQDTIVIDATHQKSMLERNNEIMNDWSKTFETKEKMKMLKIAASAAEQENSNPS